MTLDFKIVTLNELNLLVDISRTTFIDAFEKDNNPKDFSLYISSAFNKTSIKEELLNPDSTFYFVYLGNILVGYFKLNEGKAQNEQFNTTSIELERIYVYKKFQGQKIGKHILDRVIDITKQKQMDFIWLGVWEKNMSAIKFYEHNGFSKFDSHPYFIGNDKQTDWLMKLSLI